MLCGRLVRNITESSVHVSSLHRLSEEEVGEAVNLSHQMIDLANPEILRNAWLSQKNMPPLDTRLVHIRLVIASTGLEKDFFKGYGGYNWDNPVHSFLMGVAANVADRACMNLGLLSTPVREKPFERDHGEVEWEGKVREMRGVCVAPSLGRRWIKASEEALRQVCPELIGTAGQKK